MLGADLAALYGVSTKALNHAVKRNIKRFPEDFMFQLTPEEKQEVVTVGDHLSTLKFSSSLPYALTERLRSLSLLACGLRHCARRMTVKRQCGADC